MEKLSETIFNRIWFDDYHFSVGSLHQTIVNILTWDAVPSTRKDSEHRQGRALELDRLENLSPQQLIYRYMKEN